MKKFNLNRFITIVASAALFACSQDDVTPPAGPVEPAEQPVAEATAPSAEVKPPNILLIVADDLGYTDIGAYGSEIPTPNLDALANEGIRLTNFHTGRACQQTRAMMMSGLGTSAVIETLPPRERDQRDNRLTLNVATLPELMQDAGYRTYMSGKWDLGLHEGYTPSERGFDRSFGLVEAGYSHFAEYFWSDKLYFQEDGTWLDLEDLPQDFYSTKTYTDKMLEYLQAHDNDHPWFAYLPYTAPHWPLQVPKDWLDRHAGRYDEGYDALREKRFISAQKAGVIPPGGTLDGFESLVDPWSDLSDDEKAHYTRAQEIYAAMVEYLDLSIGRVISWLEETGQLGNTVVMFMSDHGASIAEHGVNTGRVPHFSGPTVMEDRDNSFENFGRTGSFIDHGVGFGQAATAPFKYGKGTLAEGGVRAAAFVHFPEAISQPRVDHGFIAVIDMIPTFMEIAGHTHPGAGAYRGREIMAIPGRSFWPYLKGDQTEMHRSTDNVGWSSGGSGAVIQGRYKAINQLPPGGMGAGPWRLYDLENDPGEHTDIAAKNIDLTGELAREWEQNWR